ncbi:MULTISPECIES: hypothetical protein [Enterobacterales]|uniref:hypothetical protein n=1 Tax=Enterobacterales TaxID=91347 RepID=UPI0015ECB07F|nr:MULTISPECIES: hypothetical protein [Enterobacterales]MCL8617188.1 hypothetical protein [Proteus mirabilis]MDC6031207.1 hypothetical protein [Proteus mirabilis]MDC6047569.1 hypothetical protein [Proteus mirabilis]MDC6052306.1 hypothetical protein [Proteus mirabilis]MDC6062850.1 hypothetical protein [Proteus mirabilis]
MKIIAFLGEKYFHYNNEYFANPTSAAFLQKMLGDENIYVISPSIGVSEKPITFSSKVREDKFTTSPYYTSTLFHYGIAILALLFIFSRKLNYHYLIINKAKGFLLLISSIMLINLVVLNIESII